MSESPRFLDIGTYAAPRGVDFPRHQHQYWELVYYASGRLRAEVDGWEADIAAGTLISTPPNTPHADAAVDAYSCIWLALDAAPDVGWPLMCHDDVDGRLEQVLRMLMAEAGDPDSELAGALVAALDVLVRRAARGPSDPHAASEVVRRAERLMEAHLAEPIDILRIAQQLGVGSSTLRQAFHRERGMSPRQRQAEIRLRHALALLRTSTLTLDSVARISGYASASHLSHRVKEATGHAPGAVRRAAVAV